MGLAAAATVAHEAAEIGRPFADARLYLKRELVQKLSIPGHGATKGPAAAQATATAEG